MARSEKPATAENVQRSANASGTTPTGDHTVADLEGSYRDNPDKPDASSVAQVQDVPEGWPGTGAAADRA